MSNRAGNNTAIPFPAARSRQSTTRKRRAASSENTERVTPQALEAEQSTLGAMIIQRAAIVKVLEILSSDDFYREVHRKIFEIMVSLFEAESPVDLITVVEEARRRGELDGIGGAAYITALIEACPSAANVSTYAEIVLETAMKRRWAETSERLGYMSYNGATSIEIIDYCRQQAEEMEARAQVGPPATLTAAALMQMDLPEPEWIVPEMITPGLIVLAGKPKIGKSWAALDLGIAVASGGKAFGSVDVEAGDVLYLALEDTLPRLAKRLGKLLQGAPAPSRLHLATEWNRIDNGAAMAMEQWIKAHPQAKMIIVDTLRKVRPQRERGEGYGDDYDDMGALKRVADKHGIAVVAVHHVRKLASDDPIDSVSGTLGLTGAADTIMVLNRRRGQRKNEATLFVSGRDAGEIEYAMNWDEHLAQWSILGDDADVSVSREREEILDILRENVAPMRAREIAALRGGNENAAYQLLWLMAKDGLIVNDGNGQFSRVSDARANDARMGDARANGAHAGYSAPVAPPQAHLQIVPEEDHSAKDSSNDPMARQPSASANPTTNLSDDEIIDDLTARCKLDLTTSYWKEHRAHLPEFGRWWGATYKSAPTGSVFDQQWPDWLEQKQQEENLSVQGEAPEEKPASDEAG